MSRRPPSGVKYAVILPDGAADEPVEKLGGRTPLAVARKPAMDWIAAHGRVGRLVTVPQGFSPGSDVATLTLFGYDPRADYSGRAPLEAAAKGIGVHEDQTIFRCNFVTVADGRMTDFTAGHISQPEADRLIADLNAVIARDFGCHFYAGVSYRNLMMTETPSHEGKSVPRVARSGRPERPKRRNVEKSKRGGIEREVRSRRVRTSGDGSRTVPDDRGPEVGSVAVSWEPDASPSCTPPHDIPDQPIERHLPRGRGSEWVRAVMERAREVLVHHEINAVRRDRGDNPVTDIWLWGQGRPRRLEPFVKRFGVKGAVIAAVDLIRGIGRCAGMEVLDVPGATGYLDTDYAAKGRAAAEALDAFDLIVVHVEAPDEAGHQGDAEAKVRAIEQIDQHVVAPLLDRLRRFPAWRILIAPDHPTPVQRRIHTDAPPPFCMAGTGIARSGVPVFAEETAGMQPLVDPGFKLIAEFFAG